MGHAVAAAALSAPPAAAYALFIATTGCGGTLDAGWNEADTHPVVDAGASDAADDEPGGQPGTDAGASDAADDEAGGQPGTDAGAPEADLDEPNGLLPVDARSPIVVCNDGFADNWQGEYAILLANTGGPPLAGIIINDSGPWPEVEDNMTGWAQMVTAARGSGLAGIPDPIASNGPVLKRPSDGEIDSTVPNRSEGAQFILDESERTAQPERPLVIVTGGRLTDVADAYLMDPTLPERVVVVSSLGSITADGGEMGIPNGEMDTWADIIVAQRFRYVQVSAFYEQDSDIPDSLLSLLPENTFTAWLKAKQPGVWETDVAADQVAVLAAAIPEFVSTVTRVEQAGEVPDGPPCLSNEPEGNGWLVTEVDGSAATARMRTMLMDPETFGST